MSMTSISVSKSVKKLVFHNLENLTILAVADLEHINSRRQLVEIDGMLQVAPRNVWIQICLQTLPRKAIQVDLYWLGGYVVEYKRGLRMRRIRCDLRIESAGIVLRDPNHRKIVGFRRAATVGICNRNGISTASSYVYAAGICASAPSVGVRRCAAADVGGNAAGRHTAVDDNIIGGDGNKCRLAAAVAARAVGGGERNAIRTCCIVADRRTCSCRSGRRAAFKSPCVRYATDGLIIEIYAATHGNIAAACAGYRESSRRRDGRSDTEIVRRAVAEVAIDNIEIYERIARRSYNKEVAIASAVGKTVVAAHTISVAVINAQSIAADR